MRHCRNRRGNSISDRPINGLSSFTRNSTISTRPLANGSTFSAEENRNIRDMSPAAAISGLMAMDSPNSSLRKIICC